MNRRILFLCCALVFVSAHFVRASQVVPGHVPKSVLGAAPRGHLDGRTTLKLAITLPLRHRPALSNLLQQIYDPRSSHYHHYLTPTQFAEQFGPAPEDYSAVIEYARAAGFEVGEARASRSLVSVTATVETIERAFHIKLNNYAQSRGNREFYAPDRDPELDLAVPVLHISGLDNCSPPRPMNLRLNPDPNSSGLPLATGSAPGGYFMGGDFRSAYVPGVSLTGTGQSVGLLEFDGYFPADVAAYETTAAQPAVPLKTILLDGFNGQPGTQNAEVALDIDMAISMAPGLSSIVIYEGELPDDILERMASDNLAKQLSASWTYTTDAASDQYFLQFAAQGQSFFNAAGDSDAYVGEPAPPTDDPNITVVGGTTLTTTGPGGQWKAETVWNWDTEFGTNYDGIGGSGGISEVYPIASWQQPVSMAANGGSPTMRNLPDVAMVADGVYLIADNGTVEWVGGTSCATPLWAALIALVNQQGAAMSRPGVGFLNPALYSIGLGGDYTNCFHDITTGGNTWSQSPTNYEAAPGYDLCTGWGTPVGSNLISVLAPSDALQISPAAEVVATGGPGGPFDVSITNYTLTAASGTISWAAGSSASWVAISPSNGALNDSTNAAVQVALDGAASALLSGIHSASILFTNLNDGVVQSRTVTLTIITAPAITLQPTNAGATGGQTVEFTAAAAGGLPLTWQWQRNGVNLTNNTRLTGAQGMVNNGGSFSGTLNSTLIISNVAAEDAGTYMLLVSNAAASVSSVGAVLTVIASPPVIVAEPVSVTNLVGEAASFFVAALGTQPLSYQWEFDGTAINGATNALLALPNLSGNDLGTYTVVVSNSLGAQTSTPALLDVLALPAGANLVRNGGFETGDFTDWAEAGNFIDCSVASGAPAVHSQRYGALLGPAGSLGYLSQTLPTTANQTYLVSFWLNGDGATPNEFVAAWDGNVILDKTNLPSSGWTNIQFYATAQTTNDVLEFGFRDDNGFLGLDDVSATAALPANGAPVIVTEPAALTVTTNGGAAQWSVFAAGAPPLSYQWQFDGMNLDGATNSSLEFPQTFTDLAGTYTVIVSNAFGTATSSNAVLLLPAGTGGLITFDDLAGTGIAIDNYQGFEWSNIFYMDASTVTASGYSAGVVSRPNVAYSGYAGASSMTAAAPFDLISGYFTAAWNDGLGLEVIGYAGNTVLYQTNYILNATNPSLETLNFLGVTSVEFSSSGGLPYSGYNGSGTEFVMDNLSVIYPSIPPIISTQPASQSAAVGDSAGFAVGASGAPPLYYFWQRDGVPISGATASVYTATNLALSDNGAEIRCVVSNVYGAAVSSNALLTVNAGDLVKNGGFELGGFTDWMTSGNFISCLVTMNAPYVHSGLYGAEFGAVGLPAYIAQNLSTVPGQWYQVACWIYGDGQTPNEALINWNGSTLLGLTNLPAVGWTNIVVAAAAVSTNTVLQLGLYDTPSYLGLDDISVTPFTPSFRLAASRAGAIDLVWQAPAGAQYQVQSTSDLAQPAWVNVGTPIAGSNTLVTLSDSLGSNGAKFYRLVVTP